ncbi:MAG: alanine racemase [Clostridiales bacterium]|nr:alanine racemase [Clostridiales bacterium]
MKRLELVTDLERIRLNALAIRKRLPDKVRMLAVVKADAYGHGAAQVARSLSGTADCFAVATVPEGCELRSAGITLPILVLGACTGSEDAQAGIDQELTLTAASSDGLKLLNETASSHDSRVRVALKIDTGMTRLGFRGKDELASALDYLKNSCGDRLILCELFTHFADGEDPAFTSVQRDAFSSAIKQVNQAGYHPMCHAAASETMLVSENQFDMVRAGIALYGTGVAALKNDIFPAQKLVTHPVAFHTISTGESVGYSRAFIAKRPSRIMTIPCGYGDGYPRILSGKSRVLLHGKSAPVVGNICMDMMMCDVTDIPEADCASTVVLLGRDGNERITPDELAELAGTIPYEIMLGFSGRVEKNWINE